MSIKIYTDGSAAPNPGKGGYAATAIKDDIIIWWCSDYENDTTNNRMELKALIAALEYARDNNLFAIPIYCDSSYAVRIYNEWAHNWAQNNWVRKGNRAIENLDLVKRIYGLSFSSSCEVIHIRGHNGEVGNEICDALATKNAQKLEKILVSEEILNKEAILSYLFEKL